MQARQFPAQISSLNTMLDFVRNEAETIGFDEHDLFHVMTAVDEALTNIISYAGLQNRNQIEIICSQTEPAGIQIILKDEGKRYDPLQYQLPNPDDDISVEERKIGGYGIFLIKKLMDKIEYTYRDNANVLTLTKYL